MSFQPFPRRDYSSDTKKAADPLGDPWRTRYSIGYVGVVLLVVGRLGERRFPYRNLPRAFPEGETYGTPEHPIRQTMPPAEKRPS